MTTDALTFDGFPLVGTTPGGGVAHLSRFDGWLSRSIRRQRDERAQQDGDYPSTGHTDGRDVTLGGQIVYTSASAAALERRQMQALGGNGLSVLAAQDALGPLSALVEVDSLVVPPVRDTMLTFTFGLHAPDPTLYGPAMFASTGLSAAAGGAGLIFPLAFPLDFGLAPGVTPGSITLVNSGNAAYWPRLRIDGPVTNPQVTLLETGDWIRVARFVDVGQWLDIDLGLRRVLLNGLPTGSLRRWTTFYGNWLAVPSKSTGSLSWVADDADPAAQLSAWSYESAWS